MSEITYVAINDSVSTDLRHSSTSQIYDLGDLWSEHSHLKLLTSFHNRCHRDPGYVLWTQSLAFFDAQNLCKFFLDTFLYQCMTTTILGWSDWRQNGWRKRCNDWNSHRNSDWSGNGTGQGRRNGTTVGCTKSPLKRSSTSNA